MPPCDPGGVGGGIGTPINVNIYGISGKLEYQGQFNNTKVNIENSDLGAGTHIVVVHTANGFHANAILVLK